MHNFNLNLMKTRNRSLLIGAMGMAGMTCFSEAAVMALFDQDIPIPVTYAGVTINLETGESSNALAGLDGGDVNFVFGGRGVTNDAYQNDTVPSWQPVRSGTGNSDPIVALGIGTEIGPSSVVSTGFGGSESHHGPFVSGTRQYIGFTVVLEDTTLAYGWAEVTLQDDNTPGEVHSWAYEDTGAPIMVGQVPEPGGAFLLLSTLWLPLLHRRRVS